MSVICPPCHGQVVAHIENTVSYLKRALLLFRISGKMTCVAENFDVVSRVKQTVNTISKVPTTYSVL